MTRNSGYICTYSAPPFLPYPCRATLRPFYAPKFRSMACAIPCMSLVGNFMGVTTQAAFVQSMILVFAGGKTGLSAVVTGEFSRSHQSNLGLFSFRTYSSRVDRAKSLDDS